MAVPQKFSDLFTELENAVIELDKRKTALEQAISSKEAKQRFLDNAIAELSAKKESLEAASAAMERDVFTLKEALTGEVNDLNTEINRLQTNKTAAYSDLKVAQKAQEAETERLYKEIIDIGKEVAHLQTQKVAAEKELNATKDLITSARTALYELDKQIKDKSDTVKTQLAELDKEEAIIARRKADLEADLSEQDDKIEAARKELTDIMAQVTDAKGQYAIFIEYEKRVKKVLEARETAILDKEAELSVQSRRSGILNNL